MFKNEQIHKREIPESLLKDLPIIDLAPLLAAARRFRRIGRISCLRRIYWLGGRIPAALQILELQPVQVIIGILDGCGLLDHITSLRQGEDGCRKLVTRT